MEAFREGKAVMTFASLESISDYYDDMDDSLGFVMPPKPDYWDSYHSYANDSVYVMPGCFDAETASDIAFAFNLYTNAVPGWDCREDQLEPFWSVFDDERAVYETLNMFAFADNGIHSKAEALLEEEFTLEGWMIWDQIIQGGSPSAYLEEISSTWDGIVREANGY